MSLNERKGSGGVVVSDDVIVKIAEVAAKDVPGVKGFPFDSQGSLGKAGADRNAFGCNGNNNVYYLDRRRAYSRCLRCRSKGS